MNTKWHRLIFKRHHGIISNGTHLKNILHCFSFIFYMLLVVLLIIRNAELTKKKADPWKKYGVIGSLILFVIKIVAALSLPQAIFNVVGLIFSNIFDERVTYKSSPFLAPVICIRIVVQRNHSDTIAQYVFKNFENCVEAGLENFLIEVVSEKPINLQPYPKIREIVLPEDYDSTKETEFKAKALQYCLQDDINILADNDYIVHVDEGTVMTKNTLKSILNFVLERKHDFGQGLVTYANDNAVSWLNIVARVWKVDKDFDRLRSQFSIFHKPIFAWKSSFMVARVRAEKEVSVGQGLEGPITEICNFPLHAYVRNFSFQFIDGNVQEKSPFTFRDFIEQRKRCFEGVTVIIQTPEILWRYKVWLAFSLYSWMSVPLTLMNFLLNFIFPMSIPTWLQVMCSSVIAVNVYLYIIGTIKSLSLQKLGLLKYVLCLLSLTSLLISSIILENISACTSLFYWKKKVIRYEDKDIHTLVTV